MKSKIKKKFDICREDGSLYAKVDTIDDIIIRTKIVKGEILDDLYYRNQYGGLDAIDKYGNSDYNPFGFINGLLRDLIKAQCEARIRDGK